MDLFYQQVALALAQMGLREEKVMVQAVVVGVEDGAAQAVDVEPL